MKFFVQGSVFFRKDMKIATSYKLQFVFQFLQVFFSVTLIYFIGRMLEGAGKSGMFAKYGCDYFSFALVGLAVNSYLRTGLVTVTNELRQMMNQGVLEAICVSDIKYSMMFVYFSLWQFGFETFRVCVYFLMGWLVFGFRFEYVNWLAGAVVMFLTILVFMMLAVISGSILIVVKRGDPVNWIFSSVGALLAGTMFPVEVLPRSLQIIARYFPLTHSLEALRRSLLMGAGLADLKIEVLSLIGFVAVLLPLTIFVNSWCIRAAKRNGSLGTH